MQLEKISHCRKRKSSEIEDIRTEIIQNENQRKLNIEKHH